MANNGILFNLRKKQITIKVNEDTEYKIIVATLKKKLPELQELYRDYNPEFYILGKEFSKRQVSAIQKLVGKYFDLEVKFSETNALGLHGIRKTFKKNIAVSKTRYVRNSLRSGKRVEYEGSIVILGDVNFGAEVIAGENIVVVGVLRGLAHAGASGNNDAIISAGSIQTKQLRISNVIKEFGNEGIVNEGLKTNAYLNEAGKMVVE